MGGSRPDGCERLRLTEVFDAPFITLNGLFWRTLNIRYQRQPFSGDGARLHGGRWNRKGLPALYLARAVNTAVVEFNQHLPRPATLVPYQIESDRIVDLTNFDDLRIAAALTSEWARLARLGGEPPGWTIADGAIAAGADGALLPSAQDRGGINLVLWRWRDASGAGEGARLTLLDPENALGQR